MIFKGVLDLNITKLLSFDGSLGFLDDNHPNWWLKMKVQKTSTNYLNLFTRKVKKLVSIIKDNIYYGFQKTHITYNIPILFTPI